MVYCKFLYKIGVEINISLMEYQVFFSHNNTRCKTNYTKPTANSLRAYIDKKMVIGTIITLVKVVLCRLQRLEHFWDLTCIYLAFFHKLTFPHHWVLHIGSSYLTLTTDLKLKNAFSNAWVPSISRTFLTVLKKWFMASWYLPSISITRASRLWLPAPPTAAVSASSLKCLVVCTNSRTSLHL